MIKVDSRILPVVTGMTGNDDLKTTIARVTFETRPDMDRLGDRVRGRHYRPRGDGRKSPIRTQKDLWEKSE